MLKYKVSGPAGALGVFFIVVVLLVFVFVFAPMLTLWALNTLSEEAKFGWYIPHNFWTYLATFVLILGFGRSSNKSD